MRLKKTVDGFKVNVEIYDNASDIVKDCEQREITSVSFNDMKKNKNMCKSWEGVESYSEALGFMKDGYKPTVEAFKDTVKNIKSADVQKRISFKNDICGFAPIVPLALKGVPQSMINVGYKPIKQKVVDVYYNITLSSCFSADDIVKAGQKVLGVILELEKQGYRFNLYAIQAYSDNSSADMLAVKVKSADKPFDLNRMSFTLTHPAFFRVIGFDWYSKVPEGKYRLSYGKPLTVCVSTEKAEKIVKGIFGKNALLISANEIVHCDDKDYLKGVLTNDKSKIG